MAPRRGGCSRSTPATSARRPRLPSQYHPPPQAFVMIASPSETQNRSECHERRTEPGRDRRCTRPPAAAEDRSARFAPRAHLRAMECTRKPARERIARPRFKERRPRRAARLQPRRVDGDLRCAGQGRAGGGADQLPPGRAGDQVHRGALRGARIHRRGRVWSKASKACAASSRSRPADGFIWAPRHRRAGQTTRR